MRKILIVGMAVAVLGMVVALQVDVTSWHQDDVAVYLDFHADDVVASVDVAPTSVLVLIQPVVSTVAPAGISGAGLAANEKHWRTSRVRAA